MEDKHFDFLKKIRSTFYHTEKWFRYLLIFGIIAFGFTVFINEIVNFRSDSMRVTYYGFAIMMAYSSICFSWARNQDKGLEKIAKKLNEMAMDSIYTGIVFLLGSFFKYVIFIKGNTFEYKEENWLYFLPIGLSSICLLYALFRFCVISIQILKRISEYRDTDFASFLIDNDKRFNKKN